jgi:hypothetical protein
MAEEDNINLLAEQFANIITITENYFVVEEVLDHRGATRKNIEFFIKWQGYDNNFNSWEPWCPDMRDNELVNQYLIQKGLQNLILKKYRNNYPFVNFN